MGWLRSVRSIKLCLFCRISSLWLVSFAKVTYNFIDPTNQSHNIRVLCDIREELTFVDLIMQRFQTVCLIIWCIYTYICVCVRVYVYVYVYVYIYMYIYICIYVCMYVYILIHVYKYIYKCIYMYMYINIHMYTY